MIAASLDVERDEVESSLAVSVLKEVILNVRGEGVVPQLTLLRGQTANEVVQHSRVLLHLAWLEKDLSQIHARMKHGMLELFTEQGSSVPGGQTASSDIIRDSVERVGNEGVAESERCGGELSSDSGVKRVHVSLGVTLRERPESEIVHKAIS